MEIYGSRLRSLFVLNAIVYKEVEEQIAYVHYKVILRVDTLGPLRTLQALYEDQRYAIELCVRTRRRRT